MEVFWSMVMSVLLCGVETYSAGHQENEDVPNEMG